MSELETKSTQSLVVNKKIILRGIVVLWGLIILFLVLSDIFINHFEWVESRPIQRLVNITRDDGLSNWFSSIQLLFISIILWLICLFLKYSTPKLYYNKWHVWGWAVIALFFTYLAIDDGAKIHERVGASLRYSLEARHEYSPSLLTKLFDIFPSYGWQFLFVPIFGLVAVFVLLFLFKSLKTKNQITLIIIGFSCYVSSVVLDFIEGMDVEVYDNVVNYFDTELDYVRHFSKLIEETFEMIGNLSFMLAFTKQLLNISNFWNIQLIQRKK